MLLSCTQCLSWIKELLWPWQSPSLRKGSNHVHNVSNTFPLGQFHLIAFHHFKQYWFQKQNPNCLVHYYKGRSQSNSPVRTPLAEKEPFNPSVLRAHLFFNSQVIAVLQHILLLAKWTEFECLIQSKSVKSYRQICSHIHFLGQQPGLTFDVIPASTTPEELSLIYSNTSAENALQQPKHQAKAATLNLSISTLSAHLYIWRRKFPISESNLCSKSYSRQCSLMVLIHRSLCPLICSLQFGNPFSSACPFHPSYFFLINGSFSNQFHEPGEASEIRTSSKEFQYK